MSFLFSPVFYFSPFISRISVSPSLASVVAAFPFIPLLLSAHFESINKHKHPNLNFNLIVSAELEVMKGVLSFSGNNTRVFCDRMRWDNGTLHRATLTLCGCVTPLSALQLFQ